MAREDLILLACSTILSAVLVCWSACYLVRQQARRWGFLDRPGGHKSHGEPVPLGGGVAIAAGVVIPLALAAMVLAWIGGHPNRAALVPPFVQQHADGLWTQGSQLAFLLAAGLVLAVTGLLDDLRGISWPWRLAIQFAVATTSVVSQDWQLTVFVDWPPLTVALSVLWIVVLINAFNMLDNMDGLSAGVAAIACFVLALVLMQNRVEPNGPQLFVAGFLLVLGGSLTGFLWHNRPPARLYMGDAGSYFVGYCLGVMTLLGSYTQHSGPRPHAVLVPLCVLAVPLYDFVSVVSIRLWEGRSIFHGDNHHFSHRLVARGIGKPQAVLLICGVALLCGMGGVALPYVNTTGAVLIGLAVLSFLALIAHMESRGYRR